MNQEAYKKAATNELERIVLRRFYDCVSAVKSIDSTISDLKIIRDTQNQLKTALRDMAVRCSCSKRTWGGPCELCQITDGELVALRNFFRQIRNAKKHNMTPAEIQEFIANTGKHLPAGESKSPRLRTN